MVSSSAQHHIHKPLLVPYKLPALLGLTCQQPCPNQKVSPQQDIRLTLLMGEVDLLMERTEDMFCSGDIFECRYCILLWF